MVKASGTHEFDFTQADFDRVRELLYDHAGIKLATGKEELVYGRIARRVRKLGHVSFTTYLDALGGDDEEFGHFINALTTNLTAFFRENHHFEYLASTAIPMLLKENAATRRIRVWSAGCSSGEEPYSIAMTLAEHVPSGWDVKILATDLDTNMVATGQRGVYDLERVKPVGDARMKRWFTKGSGQNNGMVRAKDQLRDMISFRPLNLLESWPMKGPLDIIFCRNVIIYFEHDVKEKLVSRYAQLLASHGHLFIGHSETLFKTGDLFHLKGNTIYEKV
ncbi:MAG: protein-glutamate O-methyltransferase CheR [Mariprofundaceae bacterium]